MTKPFRLRELIARMHAILRRVAPRSPAPLPTVAPVVPAGGAPRQEGDVPPDAHRYEGPDTQSAFGSVSVDYVRREVTVSGDPIHLSRKEFDLLAVLLRPPRRVRSRDELIDLLWPDTYLTDTRTLDTHIHRLRSKLEPEPTDPRFIVTVRGIGFRIDPDGTLGEPPAVASRTVIEGVSA